jgi:phenylacetate-CoA ligase
MVARSMAPELSVLVPCFDEVHNVCELTRRVLDTFAAGGLEGELILVDDGSADGTRRALTRLANAFPGRVIAAYHDRNLGIAAAWRTAAAAARGTQVAIMDADLQYPPEELLRLRKELLDSGVDIVQGARSTVGRARDTRYYYSRGLNVLLNAIFGMRLPDNKSGFLICAREVFQDLLAFEGAYRYWQSFLMVAAHAKGYSYKSIEVLFEKRRQGASFLDRAAPRVALETLAIDIPQAIWEYRARRPLSDPAARLLRGRPPAPPRPSPARSARWRAYMATFPYTHWLLTREVEKRYEILQRTQWLPPEEVRALQDEKLRRLVRHAYGHVPFYRRRMEERGLRPEDVQGQADLHKLPLLTKDEVRERLYLDLLSDNHDKRDMLRVTTSGSTGEPLVVYADRVQLEYRWAATLRSQEWAGYAFGERCVRLWHQTLGLSRSQALRERLDALLARRRFVPVFEMRADRMADLVREIAEWRPALLDGYAEALDLLARYLQSRGGSGVHPRAILSSAQTLPETSRRLIEQTFACRVFDKYGAREFSGIAYECEAHAGHHVVAESYIVETLRDGRPAAPGEVGEVVITDLNNLCLPFIRYRIGDLAVAVDGAAPCACGRGLPRIGTIEGRVQSIIQGTGGQFLPGTFFAHYLRDFDHAVRWFQVVQEQPGRLVFRVVKGGRWSAAVMDEILATFRRHLGEDLQIDLQLTDEIPMVRTGKRLASVSRLRIDFQAGAPAIVPRDRAAG